MSGSMIYRLRVSAAVDPHMDRFRRAMTASQGIWDNRGYNHTAGFHGIPGWYCWHHQYNPRTSVQARLFLPWHRAYLWDLEQKLQDQEPRAGLPWWDWTVQRDIPAAYQSAPLDGFAARLPQGGQMVPYHTNRTPGLGGRLASETEIAAALNISDWATFSDRLQDHHDAVHVWGGGSMADPSFASYDPIFHAHHCMIDRIWYLWQLRYGDGGIPGSLLDLPLDPFLFRVREVLDVQTLGYEYAVTAAEIPAPTEEDS